MSVPLLIRRIIGSLDLLLLIAPTYLDSEGVLGEIVNQGWFVWTEGGSLPVDLSPPPSFKGKKGARTSFFAQFIR